MKHPEALWSGLAWRGLAAAVTAGGLIIMAGGTGTGGWLGAPGSMAPAAFVSSAPASEPTAASSVAASQPTAPSSVAGSQPPVETAPAAPAGVNTAAGDGEVTVSWLAPASAGGSGATSYSVYESATPAFSGSKLQATVRGLGDTVTSLTNGTRYYFWVTASNGAGASSPSSIVSATPAPAAPVTAPGAPTALQAIGGDNQVTLSWSAPASTGGSPVTGYQIYAGTTPALRGAAPRMTSAGPSATVGHLPAGTTYYFTVAAVNAHGAGAMSAVATATTAAPAQPATSGPPTGLSARPDGNSQVILSWSAPAGYPQPSGYLVYAGTSPGGELGTPVSKIPVRSTDCVVAGLTSGTRYYFEVTAVGAAGRQSARSADASAVPVAVGSGTDPGAPGFPIEGHSGPPSVNQLTEVTQAPASTGVPSWLIIALAAVAVTALAGALAVVAHLRRIRRYPGRPGSPTPGALQTVGPNGPDGRQQEVLSGRPHRQ